MEHWHIWENYLWDGGMVNTSDPSYSRGNVKLEGVITAQFDRRKRILYATTAYVFKQFRLDYCEHVHVWLHHSLLSNANNHMFRTQFCNNVTTVKYNNRDSLLNTVRNMFIPVLLRFLIKVRWRKWRLILTRLYIYVDRMQ